MSVKQISKIIIKSGLASELPNSLSEAEMGFTTDTGEVFIGAPNFEKLEYRGGSGSSNNSIYPYQNIKLLTELDVPKSIVGDFYQYGPIKRIQIPLSQTPVSIFNFDVGYDTIIGMFSLYSIKDDKPIFAGNIKILRDILIYDTFQGINLSVSYSNNQITLQATNTTNSIIVINLIGTEWISQGIANV